jgi:hypothetical protein
VTPRVQAAAALVAGVLLLQAPPALAQVDLISRDVISGQADLRLAASDGEKSWLDGGFGKTRYGGEGHGGLASADIVWRPAVGFALSGYVDADWRHRIGNHLSVLVEALHVDSNRPARGYVYQAGQQAQTTLQTALKLSF